MENSDDERESNLVLMETNRENSQLNESLVMKKSVNEELHTDLHAVFKPQGFYS